MWVGRVDGVLDSGWRPFAACGVNLQGSNAVLDRIFAGKQRLSFFGCELRNRGADCHADTTRHIGLENHRFRAAKTRAKYSPS